MNTPASQPGLPGRILRQLLTALFPADCTVCGRRLPASLTTCCDTCLESLCEAGYQILPGDPGPRLKVISLFTYEKTGRRLVRAVKFHGQRRLLDRFAVPLARSAREFGVAGSGPLFCPVPSTPARMRERGGNPAEWLARALAHQLDGDVIPALRRIRRGRDQKSLDRADRLQNLKGQFRARVQVCHRLQGRALWIVDDVLTTGATLEHCALALLDAGCPPAGAIVLARTPLAGEWVPSTVDPGFSAGQTQAPPSGHAGPSADVFANS
jgi:ComF family protein